MMGGLRRMKPGRQGLAGAAGGMMLAVLGTMPSAARNGPPPKLFQRGEWTAFCDNSGGCGLANAAHRPSLRERAVRTGSASTASSGTASSWVCLWLGSTSGVDASLSLLPEDEPAPITGTHRRELFIQPVKGLSEEPVGRAMVARHDGLERYTRGAENLPSLTEALRTADVALLRETTDGPVVARIPLDGFLATLGYAQAFRTDRRPLPVVTPKPFRHAGQGTAAETEQLRREHCSEGHHRAPPIARYALAPGRQLLVMHCRLSGYNGLALALTAGRDRKARPLILTSVVDHEGVGPDFSNLLVQPELGLIEEYHKTRGAGDCGKRRRWAWNGRRFELHSEEIMPACFGAGHFQWLRMHASAPPTPNGQQRPPC